MGILDILRMKKMPGLKPKQAWVFPYIHQASRNAAGPVLGVRFGLTPHPRPVRFFWVARLFFLCHFLPPRSGGFVVNTHNV